MLTSSCLRFSCFVTLYHTHFFAPEPLSVILSLQQTFWRYFVVFGIVLRLGNGTSCGKIKSPPYPAAHLFLVKSDAYEILPEIIRFLVSVFALETKQRPTFKKMCRWFGHHEQGEIPEQLRRVCLVSTARTNVAEGTSNPQKRHFQSNRENLSLACSFARHSFLQSSTSNSYAVFLRRPFIKQRSRHSVISKGTICKCRALKKEYSASGKGLYQYVG